MLSVLIWAQTVCNGPNQQGIKVDASKERVKPMSYKGYSPIFVPVFEILVLVACA